MSKKEKDRLVGGRVTWMERSNNTKIFRNTIKAGSVFLKSSTAHHHPDELCQEKRNNISISSEECQKKLHTKHPLVGMQGLSFLEHLDGLE